MKGGADGKRDGAPRAKRLRAFTGELHGVGMSRDHDLSRRTVVRDQHVAVPHELCVGWVSHRDMEIEHDAAARRQPHHSRVLDFRDQDPAVGQRRVAVWPAVRPRGAIDTHPRATPLMDDVLVGRDLEDPAVLDVGHDDVAVRERVRIIRRMQLAAARTRSVEMAVLPDHLAGRNVDPGDDLVLLFVGDDGLAVRGDEGIIGRESLAWRQASSNREAPEHLSLVIHE